MLWLKRNLFMVLGGVTALVLLGLAGFYLYLNYAKEATVTTDLTTVTEELKALIERKPSYPNKENIDATKRESDRLVAYWNSGSKFLAGGARGGRAPLDSAQYKSLLANTIFELKARAASTGVTLPPNYNFTFQKQVGLMTFTKGSIEPLVSELSDIQGICEVVFDAKVSSLTSIRRVPVGDEVPGEPEYLSKTISTNADSGTTVWSYEINFVGFTAELAEALSGLAKAQHCYIVKSVNVSPSQAGAVADASGAGGSPFAMAAVAPAPVPMAPPPGVIPSGMTMTPDLAARLGLGRGGRPNPDRPPPAPGTRGPTTPPVIYNPAAVPSNPNSPVAPGGVTPTGAGSGGPASKTPVIVLEEKPLQITLYVEVVKLLAAK